MKNKNYIALIIAGVVAGGGYYLYTLFKSGKLKLPGSKPNEPDLPKLPESPVTPVTPVTESPKTTTPVATSNKASQTKVKELQGLLVKRYSQLNMKGYGVDQVDGDAGRTASSNTHQAINSLRPQTFTNFGLVSSSNVQKYIDAFTKDVADFVAQEQKQATTKSRDDKKKANAKKIETYINGGKYFAELISDVNAPKLIWDNLSSTYKVIGGTLKLNKGKRFYNGDLKDRGNGTIMYVSGDYRYPIDPDLFILRAK
mgnify:FL=1